MRRFVALVLLLGVTCWMTSAHWQHVDIGKLEDRIQLHEQVLENSAPDPYQYKLWIIEHGMAWTARATGHPLQHVWMANTLLSLLFLVLLHHLWLRQVVGAREALFGSVLLGALANAVFVIYFLHSYEFWGVGLFCLLLAAIQRDTAWWKLALLCLLTGLVWEKHALLAALWGLWQLIRRRPFWPSLLQGLAMLTAALAVPLLVRWHLGTERALVDGDTYWSDQDWIKVAWFQIPYMLPFLLMLLTSWRRQPTWIRLLWLYLPVLFAAYLSQHFIVHETRSFWPLVPVFTATAAVWFSRPTAEATTPKAPPAGATPATPPAPRP